MIVSVRLIDGSKKTFVFDWVDIGVVPNCGLFDWVDRGVVPNCGFSLIASV